MNEYGKILVFEAPGPPPADAEIIDPVPASREGMATVMPVPLPEPRSDRDRMIDGLLFLATSPGAPQEVIDHAAGELKRLRNEMSGS